MQLVDARVKSELLHGTRLICLFTLDKTRKSDIVWSCCLKKKEHGQ